MWRSWADAKVNNDRTPKNFKNILLPKRKFQSEGCEAKTKTQAPGASFEFTRSRTNARDVLFAGKRRKHGLSTAKRFLVLRLQFLIEL